MRDLITSTVGGTMAAMGMLGLTSIVNEPTVNSNDGLFMVLSAAFLLCGLIVMNLILFGRN